MIELHAGEHIITLRVYDTGGNVGLGKAVFRAPTSGTAKP